MKATIYHNARCGTSRRTLELLQEKGADVTVVDYLRHPPSPKELARLYALAGIDAHQGLRSKEPLAATLHLPDPDVSDDVILETMVAHPILINRPIVETEKGARLCRPPEKVLEIL